MATELPLILQLSLPAPLSDEFRHLARRLEYVSRNLDTCGDFRKSCDFVDPLHKKKLIKGLIPLRFLNDIHLGVIMPNYKIQSINNFFQNEKEEQLEVNMWLKYQWMDENLKWDPEQYENGL